MKVIVNQTTELQVVDEEGNVLYDWNPFKDKVSNCNNNFDNSTKSIIEAIHDSYNSTL